MSSEEQLQKKGENLKLTKEKMDLPLWETLKGAVAGICPAALVTIVAMCWPLYHVISGLFGLSPERATRSLEEPTKPDPQALLPVNVGEISEEELKLNDGSDPKKPLLLGIKGQIYDVSKSGKFYGPGGPYAMFAGKDISRALAKMSIEEKYLTGDISGLSSSELDILRNWEYKFMNKYAKVGTLKKKDNCEPAATNVFDAPARTALDDDNSKPELFVQAAASSVVHHNVNRVYL